MRTTQQCIFAFEPFVLEDKGARVLPQSRGRELNGNRGDEFMKVLVSEAFAAWRKCTERIEIGMAKRGGKQAKTGPKNQKHKHITVPPNY